MIVGGKRHKEHLEAVDHYDALQWKLALAGQGAPVGEALLRELHRRIVARSEPEIAGRYSRYPRRIAGSPVVFPNPAKIPDLLKAYGRGLETAPRTPEAAFTAHLRLTAIHPFGDSNGRTAGLLLNLLLIRAGYPPIAVRPEDRPAYLDTIERAALAEDPGPFQALMHERLRATFRMFSAPSGRLFPSRLRK